MELNCDDDAMKTRFIHYANRIREGRLTIEAADFKESDDRDGRYTLTLQCYDRQLAKDYVEKTVETSET